MAKPSVFISSTYYDLKHIRSSIGQFVTSLGYEPILSEQGNIAYSPASPLDESCYSSAQKCDLFVLIIGGRYGSEVSETRGDTKGNEFFDAYDSVIRREFESAYDDKVPAYILIEKGVYAEYQTYLKNKENTNIEYAHVDSPNVFRFIEFVHSKRSNNPIFPFEKQSEISSWLKEQWAGRFKEMLNKQQELEKVDSISRQVTELSSINTTLKNYLEELIKQSNKNVNQGIILEEQIRREQERLNLGLMNIPYFREYADRDDMDLEEVKKAFTAETMLQVIVNILQFELKGSSVEQLELEKSANDLINKWKKDKSSVFEQVNQIRALLILPKLDVNN